MNGAISIAKNEELEGIVNPIKEMIRSRVLTTFTKTTRLDDSRIVEIENSDDYVYGHWMAFILISGSSIRVTLKLHFSNRIAKLILGSRVKSDIDKAKLERISMDFMKEQCNLIAGALKTTFNNSNVITGLSIPLITRGFDEAVFSDELDKEKITDVWELSWGEGQGTIVCSSVTEILKTSSFKDFTFEGDDNSCENEGEFL